MKIVYFIDHLRPDGTQFVLKQLVRGLGARGHEQVVICLNDSWDEVVVQQVREHVAELHIVGKLALASGLGLLSIWRWLRRGRFDVAVTLLFASDVIGISVARLAGVPRIVSSIQTHDEFYAQWQRWLVRRTMRWADVVLLNSSHIREFAISEEGAPPERLRVIYNSIRASDYAGSGSRPFLDDEFDLPPGVYLLGSVGRLIYQKGFDVLLPALAAIERQDIHLLIAGTGEELVNLRAQAEALGLANRVHFAGYRRDVPRLLNGLDLYIQPSRFEGMPIAVLEAMAAGCPIVATGVDGTRELIDAGVHGWLIPPENSEVLAEAIQAAVDDPAEAKRRGMAARQRVVEHFSEDAMITAWEKVLADRVQVA